MGVGGSSSGAGLDVRCTVTGEDCGEDGWTEAATETDVHRTRHTAECILRDTAGLGEERSAGPEHGDTAANTKGRKTGGAEATGKACREQGEGEGGAAGHVAMLQDILKSRQLEHEEGPQLQDTQGEGGEKQTTKGQLVREREGGSQGGPHGTAGDTGSRMVCTGARDEVLHGEPSGQPAETALHATVGTVQASSAEGSGLLRLQPLLHEDNKHMDEHEQVEAGGTDGDGEMRRKMLSRVHGGHRAVGTYLQAVTGELAIGARKGEESKEEHDAAAVAGRAAGAGTEGNRVDGVRKAPAGTGQGKAEQAQRGGGTQLMAVEEGESSTVGGEKTKPRKGQLTKSEMERSGEREELD